MAQPTSAFDALTAAFTQAGLPTLATAVLAYAKQGLGSDEALLQLQTTPEYQQRFSGNTLRAQKGYAVLSPADYLAKEDQLRAQFKSYDLPAGFHDDNSSLGKLIATDMGADELGQRLSSAQSIVTDGAMTGVLAYAQQHLGLSTGDLTAYFLDPTRSAPLLQKQARVAGIGAAAAQTGFGDLSTADAQRLDAEGITAATATSGFSQAAGAKGLTEGLDPTGNVTKDDLQKALVEQNADALTKVQRAQDARKAGFAQGGGFATNQQGVAGLGSANV